MSDEKKVEAKVEKSDDVAKLAKQVASLAFIVRKTKNWLEEKMGADLDGDGRVGSGPFKKIGGLILVACLAFSAQAEDKTAIAYWSTNAKITAAGFVGDATIQAGSINNLTILTNAAVNGAASVGSTLAVTGAVTLIDAITIGGKSTLNGELEVNSSDVDINMKKSTDEIDIAQTNETGASGVAMLTITDARTGSTANDTNEATLKITAGGTYAISVNNGVVYALDGFEGVGSSLTALSAANITAGGSISAVNLAAATNLPTSGMTLGGANVKSLLDCADYSAMRTALTLRPGTDVQAYDADLDALALRNLVNMTNLSDAAVSGTKLSAIVADNAVNLTNVQAASALSGVVPLANGGAGNASGILKANGAGLVAAASAGTDYLAPSAVAGNVKMVSAAITTTNAVVACQAGTLAGGNLSERRLLRFWVSPTLGGAASTNNIEKMALADGTAIDTVTANADYRYVTAATGTNTVTLNATGSWTNYLYASDGSSVTNIALVFPGP